MVSDSDDHVDGRQPAGVRAIAKMEALNGAVLFALAGAITGAVVAAPPGGAMLYFTCAVAGALYFPAMLFVIGRYGLLAGRPWAQRLATHMAIFFILLGGIPLLYAIISRIRRRPDRTKISMAIIVVGLIAAVAGSVILWYLQRPHVNRYFDGTYGSPDAGRGAWFWRYYKIALKELRVVLDEVSGSCNAPFWDTLNGLRVVLDKML